MLDITSGKVLTRIMDRPSTIYDIRLEIADYLEVANDTELTNAERQSAVFDFLLQLFGKRDDPTEPPAPEPE